MCSRDVTVVRMSQQIHMFTSCKRGVDVEQCPVFSTQLAEPGIDTTK